MTHPMGKARLRPMIAPTFAPVIISIAITSVYAVIAPWIPVTVVPTSLATVAIDTFITELSSVIRNCPAASVSSTSVAPLAPRDAGASIDVAGAGIVLTTPCRRSGRALCGELLPPVPRAPVADPSEREQHGSEEQERAEEAPRVPHRAEDREQDHTGEDSGCEDPDERQPELPAELVVVV